MDADLRPEEPDGEDGGRARLSKRAVVDRALKLADADGLDALTIRKLAQDLGVTPMALYWHFRSKEDLLEGVAEQVWGEIEVRVDPSVPWWAQLQAGLESLIRVLRAHPSAPQLLLEHEKRNEAALRATEAALEILLGAGFDPQHAAEIARSTLWTGITLVMSEAGYHPELSPRTSAPSGSGGARSSSRCCPRPATRTWSSAPSRWPTANRSSTTGWASSCSSPGSGPSPSACGGRPPRASTARVRVGEPRPVRANHQ